MLPIILSPGRDSALVGDRSSAVATYTDAGLAPAVTMLTYQGGLLGNAVWWIPYVIWMPLGAVLWSKYWRRLGTVTSAEMLSIRYSGRFAHVYRRVYSVFMSFGFIVVLMGYVSGWLGARAWSHSRLAAGAPHSLCWRHRRCVHGYIGPLWCRLYGRLPVRHLSAGKYHSGAYRARRAPEEWTACIIRFKCCVGHQPPRSSA